MTKGSPRQIGVKLLVAFLLAFVAAAAFGVFGYNLVIEKVDEVKWRARIVGLQPSIGCHKMLLKGASDTLGAVIDIAGSILGGGKAVDESSRDVEHGGEKADAGRVAADPDHPKVDDREEAGGGDDAADCKLEIAVGLEVDNVLPVGMDVQILSVNAKVARMTVEEADISFSDIPVWAPSEKKIVLRIGLKIGTTQMMMAANGLVMTRKLRMKAQIVVKGTALWGLVEQTRTVEIERALTVEELIGGLDGSVGGK